MANIKVFALGGLGENGKNMYIVEVDEHIFILDAGLKYPDIDMYGVDAVIADMTYLVENKDRIEGVFVSHGHEDHINALPYLLKQIPTRIYGTHFTISLIENLLSDNKMNIKHFKLFRINENKVLGFGDVSVSFSIRVIVFLNQLVLLFILKMVQLYIVRILILDLRIMESIKHHLIKLLISVRKKFWRCLQKVLVLEQLIELKTILFWNIVIKIFCSI